MGRVSSVGCLVSGFGEWTHPRRTLAAVILDLRSMLSWRRKWVTCAYHQKAPRSAYSSGITCERSELGGWGLGMSVWGGVLELCRGVWVLRLGGWGLRVEAKNLFGMSLEVALLELCVILGAVEVWDEVARHTRRMPAGRMVAIHPQPAECGRHPLTRRPR